MSLLNEWAASWASVALANIEREYPHVEFVHMNGPDDLPGLPRERHPAFYGAYDWHSSVEMHWVLVRLLRLVPDRLDEEVVIARLERHLNETVLALEAANLPRWERPYGYAWALMLARELGELASTGGEARRWQEAIGPLVAEVVADLTAWLGRARYPVRTGLHSNSAFALSLALRHARRHEPALAAAIVDKAAEWFGGDIEAPLHLEPSGSDFLSPSLCEAELMTHVLRRDPFSSWLDGFMPTLGESGAPLLLTPVEVSDPSDGQIAHLHGLNLSRAWCFRSLAQALRLEDPRRDLFLRAAEAHQLASLEEAVGSHYMVEHWLAAYATLLATVEEDSPPA